MNREQLIQFVRDQYGLDEEYLWLKFPNYAVFRHRENNKWFALIMDVPKNKIGLDGNEIIDIVDFKCDPLLIGSLICEDGIYPAYHMSKASWVTVALDGSADDEKIKRLLDMSFEMTAAKKGKKKNES